MSIAHTMRQFRAHRAGAGVDDQVSDDDAVPRVHVRSHHDHSVVRGAQREREHPIHFFGEVDHAQVLSRPAASRHPAFSCSD